MQGVHAVDFSQLVPGLGLTQAGLSNAPPTQRASPRAQQQRKHQIQFALANSRWWRNVAPRPRKRFGNQRANFFTFLHESLQISQPSFSRTKSAAVARSARSALK